MERATAYTCTLKELSQGQYSVSSDEQAPHFLIGDKKISRINIIGRFVRLDAPIIALGPQVVKGTFDDGTASMDVRSFEPIICADDITLTDTVRLFGKVRQFQQTTYIVPEIIRKIPAQNQIQNHISDSATHITTHTLVHPNLHSSTSIQTQERDSPQPALTQTITKQAPQKKPLSVIDVLDTLDTPHGISKDIAIRAIADAGFSDPQKRIHNLLLSGDIFELRPDVYKLLK
jgi:RPA family protein